MAEYVAGCKISLNIYWATKVPGTVLGTGHQHANPTEMNHCSYDAYTLLGKIHNENRSVSFSMLGGSKI